MNFSSKLFNAVKSGIFGVMSQKSLQKKFLLLLTIREIFAQLLVCKHAWLVVGLLRAYTGLVGPLYNLLRVGSDLVYELISLFFLVKNGPMSRFVSLVVIVTMLMRMLCRM